MNLPPSDEEIRQVQNVLIEWGEQNFQDFPWRNPERLWYGLIGEILLQRTRAENAVPVYEEFVSTFPTLQSLASASQQEIEEVIYPLGLHWRAPLIKKLGERLAELERVPKSLSKLEDLPGVGPYTAAAWISFHGGGRGVLVDANIVRWLCRMVGAEYDGETRRKKWLIDFADRLTPEHDVRAYNYAALDFTMSICLPSSPRCEECPIGPRLCKYGRERLNKS